MKKGIIWGQPNTEKCPLCYTESTNNIDQGVEENNDISGDISGVVVSNRTDIQRTVYAGIHSMANNTMSISGNLSLEDDLDELDIELDFDETDFIEAEDE